MKMDKPQRDEGRVPGWLLTVGFVLVLALIFFMCNSAEATGCPANLTVKAGNVSNLSCAGEGVGVTVDVCNDAIPRSIVLKPHVYTVPDGDLVNDPPPQFVSSFAANQCKPFAFTFVPPAAGQFSVSVGLYLDGNGCTLHWAQDIVRLGVGDCVCEDSFCETMCKPLVADLVQMYLDKGAPFDCEKLQRDKAWQNMTCKMSHPKIPTSDGICRGFFTTCFWKCGCEVLIP